MSRYSYDYAFTPGKPKGWRSLCRNVLVVGAIAAISAVSGGVVALDLLGPGATVTDRTTQARPVTVRVARAATPAPVQPAATVGAAVVEKPQAAAVTATPAPPPAQPSSAPAPQAAPTQNVASTVSAPAVEEPKAAQVPERELTFTTGYARRRAVQAAATAGTKTDVAHLEEQNQIGRGGKVKPRTTVAHHNGPEQPARFDLSRQQALALGDPRATRRPPPQQQGGLFGGFFRGMF